MTNPGVYYSYASVDAWPFLALVGALLSVPLFAFALLMVIGGQIPRIRSVPAAIVLLAIGAASIGGLVTADSDFREAESAHRTAYLEQASAWLEQGYGLSLTDEELSQLLTLQGVSGRFEGADAVLTVRGDRTTGSLSVTARNGAPVPRTDE